MDLTIKESFVQKIWDLKLFDKVDFKGIRGEKIVLFKFGTLNTNAGPDFLDAAAEIDGIRLYGSIEIHTNTSDWDNHNHTSDPLYNSVILHVVWHNDVLKLNNNFSLPTIELKNYVEKKIKKSSLKIEAFPSTRLVCENFLKLSSSKNIFSSEKEQAIKNRLESKSREILTLNKELNYNWEETIYKVISKNFGFGVNSEAFYELSKLISLKTVQKVLANGYNLEALFFGVAGFLNSDIEDPYYKGLQSKFSVLEKKYQISNNSVKRHIWKFLRMRPHNFPTIRIAQFVAALANIESIVNSIFQNDVELFRNNFHVCQADYWMTHYDFGKKFKTSTVSSLSDKTIDLLVVNSFIPLCMAYRIANGSFDYEDIIQLLRAIPSEKNKITKIFKNLATLDSAYDSQAFYQLYKEKCSQKKCLSCNVYASLFCSL